MPKRRVVFALSFLFMLTGFVYGGYFLGVPYPDPTLEQQESWDFHAKVDVLIWTVGVLLFLVGLVSVIAHRVRRDRTL